MKCKKLIATLLLSTSILGTIMSPISISAAENIPVEIENIQCDKGTPFSIKASAEEQVNIELNKYSW
ncbi:hypothetical protein [Enterococcus sp. C76]|uniref:hypothetical protein n=1 Tax=Enterococcus sp. C76 TaxID=3231334 RepID=UPI00349FFFE2